MSEYRVERTQPTVYLDKGGRAVQGFTVYVELVAFDEIHELHVPSLDPNVVSEAADKLLEQRTNLAALGV